MANVWLIAMIVAPSNANKYAAMFVADSSFLVREMVPFMGLDLQGGYMTLCFFNQPHSNTINGRISVRSYAYTRAGNTDEGFQFCDVLLGCQGKHRDAFAAFVGGCGHSQPIGQR